MIVKLIYNPKIKCYEAQAKAIAEFAGERVTAVPFGAAPLDNKDANICWGSYGPWGWWQTERYHELAQDFANRIATSVSFKSAASQIRALDFPMLAVAKSRKGVERCVEVNSVADMNIPSKRTIRWELRPSGGIEEFRIHIAYGAYLCVEKKVEGKWQYLLAKEEQLLLGTTAIRSSCVSFSTSGLLWGAVTWKTTKSGAGGIDSCTLAPTECDVATAKRWARFFDYVSDARDGRRVGYALVTVGARWNASMFRGCAS